MATVLRLGGYIGRTMQRSTATLALGSIGVVSLCAAGCAPNNADILHFLREHEHEVSAIEYRVGIPDAIEISAPRILEIDAEAQTISPDGKLSLRLLGDVKVVGMTAKEIAAKLEVLLSRYYTDPKVRVRVASYQSKNYYVSGPFAASGKYPYTGRDTLLDAVMKSGNSQGSWRSRIKVIRPSHGDGEPRTIIVNVDRMIREGDWSKNILLEPDDIVYIPPTPLAWVGLRIREVLDPMAPVFQAYLTPAYVLAANDVYGDDGGGSGGVSLGQRPF